MRMRTYFLCANGVWILNLHVPTRSIFCNGSHDDVIKWKHFPRNWPFVRGIHRSPVNSPHKGQWRGALMFSLICVWIIDWVNNREAGDLRRHRGHYDVIVMFLLCTIDCQHSTLTHWGRVMHICVSTIPITTSDNGLSPAWHQAIIWPNAVILLIGSFGINFREILIEKDTFLFNKMHSKYRLQNGGYFVSASMC